jgi:hypothetical protein
MPTISAASRPSRSPMTNVANVLNLYHELLIMLMRININTINIQNMKERETTHGEIFIYGKIGVITKIAMTVLLPGLLICWQ